MSNATHEAAPTEFVQVGGLRSYSLGMTHILLTGAGSAAIGAACSRKLARGSYGGDRLLHELDPRDPRAGRSS